ncbi:MAG: RIP metalloprotease RseP [Candidatus Marinimicrobia bacterium]|nr:RIP metalloprotease RseP [Candidatus Neomarinimicrobiota bacterium]
MIITILAVVFVLSVLVFAHELGHFLAARSVGVRVDRFYIGFNLFGLGIKKKIGHTEYGLGLFPLGGYVKMAGMIDETMDTNIKGEPWEFQSKSSLEKIWVMSAGVLANMVLAIVVFTGLTLGNGIAESDPAARVGSLVPDYPALAAGLKAGDVVTAINGKQVESWEAMTALIHNLPDEEIEIVVDREGQTHNFIIKTKPTEALVGDEIKVVGMVGIGPVVNRRPAGLGEAIGVGFYQSWRWLALTYKSLKMIITGAASFRDIGGPIMIAQMAGQSAQMGFSALLGLLAIISINFAFINILPVPALDGGQIFVVLVEAVSRKPLSLRARMVIQQVGMLLLLTLMVAVVYNDIMRIVTQ